jgi:rare lipoprotein A
MMSAVTPAPEEGSNPAIVRAIFIKRVEQAISVQKQTRTLFSVSFQKNSRFGPDCPKRAKYSRNGAHLGRISASYSSNPFSTRGTFQQGISLLNSKRLFDLAFFCQDNIEMGDAMKMIPVKRDGSVSSKLGVAVVTLLVALGVSASASDPSPSQIEKSSQQPSKARKWYQIGQASWYGRYFQGKKTANGEQYDMNGLTCAHRRLPLNTWIRVTNLRNRRSVFVRVNDRGPMPEDRIVDLSYGAAKAVGITGVGKVKLETLAPADSEMMRQLMAQVRMPLLAVQGL